MESADSDRRRRKGDEELSGGRRTKRARLDEERTSSERELALHPSDEDIFSLGALVTSKDIEPLDVSPGSYLSSDGGGSFQLMKTGEEKEKKRARMRKYRGATEEMLEGERERERRERRSKEVRRYREDEERGSKRGSSAHSSDGGRGGRERGRGGDDRHLYPPSDRYYSREYRRGGDQRRDGEDEYLYPLRKGGGGVDDERRGGRRGRERDESYRRYSTSPRPSDYRPRSEWRGESLKQGSYDRNERRERSEQSLKYDRDKVERKHRKRKRSREERSEAKRERRKREREGSLESGGLDEKGNGSPRDKIEDWIKELEGEDSGGRDRREGGDSSSDPGSSDEDENPREDVRNRHSSVSDSDRSEEGEIVEERVSTNESEEERSESESSGPRKEPSSSAPEPVLRSKFDDTSGSSSEGEEHRGKHLKRNTVAFAQRSQNAYSGYAEVVSGSDQSDTEPVVDEAVGDRLEDVEEEKVGGDNDGGGNEAERSPVEHEDLEDEVEDEDDVMSKLPPYLPALMGCRNVEEYEWLNRIEEGTYGVVYRARDKRTGEVVALKKLKMEKEKEGFPITSLREINMLLKAKHPNVVFVRELVVGSNMDRIYIVMDYVEHDMKALMETMKQPFLEGEVKILLLQLLRAVHHLHDNWILHRDLKTSNLLLSHKGILKVGDFGLAREYGSPLRPYTPVVVTLWYRAPELLLGCKSYSTPVDMWSVGCIFAEFLQHKPLFMGKSEIDQLNQIFKELGTPSEEIWPGYNELPVVKKVTFTKRPYNNLRKRFPYLTQSGFDLLNKFLTYDPKRRITGEKALEDSYFKESPLPVDPSMFPTWPAKSEKVRRKSREKSPTPPIGGNYLLSQAEEDGFKITTAQHGKAAVGAGFSLKF